MSSQMLLTLLTVEWNRVKELYWVLRKVRMTRNVVEEIRREMHTINELETTGEVSSKYRELKR